MKNNRITMPQFCFCTFLCSLAALLYVNYNPSLVNCLMALLPLIINILVVLFYKGKINRFTKVLASVYFTLLCTVICVGFCEYMCDELGYGPYWGIALILLGFSYFCTVKGLEPLMRAAVIISFFVIFSVIYIGASSFNLISFTFKIGSLKGLIIPYILFLPSALYIVNFDNIIPDKKYSVYISSAVTLIVLLYFYLLPNKNTAVGIFKGADGLLLAVFCVAVLYTNSSCTVALFKNFKHRYLSNFIYLSVVFVLSVTALYSEFVMNIIKSDISFVWGAGLLAVAIIFSSVNLLQRVNKNTKNY